MCNHQGSREQVWIVVLMRWQVTLYTKAFGSFFATWQDIAIQIEKPFSSSPFASDVEHFVPCHSNQGSEQAECECMFAGIPLGFFGTVCNQQRAFSPRWLPTKTL